MRCLSKLISMMYGLALVVGCGGQISEKPPVHLVKNMDEQPKVKAQSKSRFYADGRAMRLPVEGTLSRGMLREDSGFYYTGRDDDSAFLTTLPMSNSIELMRRGRERYDIFCGTCHGLNGDGQSMVARKGMIGLPTFHDDRLRKLSDGEMFDVITNGKRNMSPYKYQIPATDRWAIIAYIRALQRSQNAVAGDVPKDELKRIQ